MRNMYVCPVESATHRYYSELDEASAFDEAFEMHKVGLIQSAESGIDTNWLEFGENWRFEEKVAVIESDSEGDKLGRIKSLSCPMIKLWAEYEAQKYFKD